MGNGKLRAKLLKVKYAPVLIKEAVVNPALTVERLQDKVREQAEALAEISKNASDGTKLGMIRAIQKKFPDAKPKCPNCSCHSLGYDDFIEHLRFQHGASI